MDRFKSFVNSWTHGEDKRTWVAHSVIALFIALVVSLIAWAAGVGDPVIVGAAVAIGYYLIRELEQTLYSYVDHKHIKVVDGIMDVVSPAICVTIVAAIAEAIA